MAHAIKIMLLSCLLSFIGCGARRDLVQDPANSPIVIPLDLKYDAGQNAVVLAWEYLGIEPATRYQFWRTERDGIHVLPWHNLPVPSRDVNSRADVWDMTPIADFAIHAGEQYRYILRTETAGSRAAEAPVGEVQVPGARLENIRFSPGNATVTWHLPKGMPTRYELLRFVDGEAAQVIFQSENPAETRFTDVLTEGNRKYTYRLRNVMDRDEVLESRDSALHPYKRRREFNIVEASNLSLTLTAAAALGSPALALLATPDAISARQINQAGYVGSPQDLPVPNRTSLQLASLSIAVTPVGNPVVPHVLLGGILTDTKQVQLSAFQNGVSEIPWHYRAWPVGDANSSLAMAVAPDGAIWAGVEQTLKAYVFAGNAIVERGTYDTSTEGAILSLAAFGSEIWLVTTQGKMFRTAYQSEPLVWDEVVPPVDAFPVWIGGGAEAVFVLDAAQNRVLVFNGDGHLIMWWRGLDDLALHAAGLAVSGVGDVYVWDTQNHVALFRSVPAALVRFAKE